MALVISASWFSRLGFESIVFLVRHLNQTSLCITVFIVPSKRVCKCSSSSLSLKELIEVLTCANLQIRWSLNHEWIFLFNCFGVCSGFFNLTSNTWCPLSLSWKTHTPSFLLLLLLLLYHYVYSSKSSRALPVSFGETSLIASIFQLTVKNSHC